MMDPDRFYYQAQRLMTTQTNNEEDFRTAISRAYYSVFLIAWYRIMDKRPDLLRLYKEDESKHYKVKRALKILRHGNISGKLNSLSRARGTADYEMETPVDRTFANDELLLAKDIRGLLKYV